jgi:hypothetical protein
LLKSCLIASLTLLALPSRAWDQESAVPRPEVRGTWPVGTGVLSAELVWDGDQVFERYVIESRLPGTVTVALEAVAGPARRAGVLDAHPDGLHSEWQVQWRDRPLAPRQVARALLAGRDLTPWLQTLKVDPARSLADDAYRQSWSRRTLDRLVRAGAVRPEDASRLPTWSVVLARGWTLQVPPGVSTLQWRYRLRAGVSQRTADDPALRALAGQHCRSLGEPDGGSDAAWRLTEHVWPLGVGDIPLPPVLVLGRWRPSSPRPELIWSCQPGLALREADGARVLSGGVQPLGGRWSLVIAEPQEP